MTATGLSHSPKMNLDEETLIHNLQVTGHVGFDSLPDQIVINNVGGNKTYTFNLLCIGETGIGKSTLVDSLFNISSVDLPCNSWSSASHSLSSVKLDSRLHELHESGVQLNLTVVETAGFGDQLNKEESCGVILEYLDEQFEAYFREELRIERCLSLYRDTRIHACLYFISPTGGRLKAIDLLCLEKLHQKVNIIPVIGKADALAKGELHIFKEAILGQLAANKIKAYDCSIDDETIASTASRTELPFAVVGSREFIHNGNKLVRGRQYPWGNVLVENENHCDFVSLREMLIRSNMVDLKELTHECHYEKYRTERLIHMGFDDKDGETSFQEMCKQKLGLHFQEQSQIEDDLVQRMNMKKKEKEEELKELEREIYTKYNQLKEKHLEETKSINHLRKQLEDDMSEFRCLSEHYLSQQQHPHKKLGSPNKTFSLGSLGRTKKN